MEDTLGYYAQIIMLVLAIFFALMAGSGLVNLYLRYHDRLPLDKPDIKSLVRHAGFAVLLTVVSQLFRILPFFMALGFLLCAVVLFQVFKIMQIGKLLEK